MIDSSRPNFFVYTIPEPIGVVAAITPWNSPTLILSYKLAPALAAGCTFVLKPASQAPVSALLFARLVEEAGFPPGVFNVVTGPGEGVGEHLISHPGVGKIAFTGSVKTGIAIAARAASNLTPVSLELGGKSPNIVFADADLPAAVDGVIAGIFGAAGQSCVAGSRLLIERSLHDQFVERLVTRAKAIKLGDPMLPDTEMGPLAFRAQLDKVSHYVDVALSEGALVVAGGAQPQALLPGYFFEPTVFVDVKPTMRIANEEVFGPVLAVMPFDDEEAAVALANSTALGLAAGIWTNDVRRAHRIIGRLQAGTIYVNSYRLVSHEVPFGGYKGSGYGRDNGVDSLREYLRLKSVWIETAGAPRDPFRLG